MGNTSATGGYLSPTVVSPPLEDADLDALLQPVVIGITGLPGNMVRPRWQPGNPKQPEPSVNWCAIGVTVIKPDAGAYIEHVGAGSGQDNMQRHEEIELACTFYGPLAGTYAAMLRDGLSIPQNLDLLQLQAVGLIDCTDARAIPELVNQQWVRRFDITARFRRQVKRSYGILNILSANGTILDDSGHVNEAFAAP